MNKLIKFVEGKRQSGPRRNSVRYQPSLDEDLTAQTDNGE